MLRNNEEVSLGDVVIGDYLLFNYYGGHDYGGKRFVRVDEVVEDGIIGQDLMAVPPNNVRRYKSSLASNIEIFIGHLFENKAEHYTKFYDLNHTKIEKVL